MGRCKYHIWQDTAARCPCAFLIFELSGSLKPSEESCALLGTGEFAKFQYLFALALVLCMPHAVASHIWVYYICIYIKLALAHTGTSALDSRVVGQFKIVLCAECITMTASHLLRMSRIFASVIAKHCVDKGCECQLAWIAKLLPDFLFTDLLETMLISISFSFTFTVRYSWICFCNYKQWIYFDSPRT